MADMVLQWGRAQMSAEMNWIVFGAPLRSLLQWGRAQMSAEIQPFWVGRTSLLHRFNGAALR